MLYRNINHTPSPTCVQKENHKKPLSLRSGYQLQSLAEERQQRRSLHPLYGCLSEWLPSWGEPRRCTSLRQLKQIRYTVIKTHNLERETHTETDRQMTRYILTYVYVHVLLTASVMPVITLEKIANTIPERASEMPYWTELYCTLITVERFR